jgi:hypothetical protein
MLLKVVPPAAQAGAAGEIATRTATAKQQREAFFIINIAMMPSFSAYDDRISAQFTPPGYALRDGLIVLFSGPIRTAQVTTVGRK